MVNVSSPRMFEDDQEVLDPRLLARVARDAEVVRDTARRLGRNRHRMRPEELALLNAKLVDAVGRLAEHLVTGRRISVREEE